MSIELSGPNAYDYQYLASAYLALSIYVKYPGTPNIYIEKTGGEDAEITYSDEYGQQHILELQVKSDAGTFDVEHLCKIICHFGNRQTSDNLLNRLFTKKENKAVILIQGRCDDAMAHFLAHDHQFDRKPLLIPTEVSDKMQATIKNHEKNGKSELGKKRHQFCKNLVGVLVSSGHWPAICDKIFIYEKLLQNELAEKSINLLFKKLNIPQLQANLVLDNLVKTIKSGRDDRYDIGADFIRLIDLNQAIRPIVRPEYLSRPEEIQLTQQLKSENFLLLSGRSLCGKSSTAKSIAKQLTSEGYLYQLTSNYELAERFLLSADTIDRVCLLDDPMGFIYQERLSDEIWHKVNHLIANLPPGRKLIVTVNNDVLKRLRVNKDGRFTDLTVTDNGLAFSIWQRLERNFSVNTITGKRVADSIKSSAKDGILQPGQLEYIAKNWRKLESNPQVDLWEFGSIDADRVAHIVRQKDGLAIRAFRTMAMACNTLIPVNESHLSYLFSDATIYPAIRRSQFGLPGSKVLELEEEDSEFFPVYPPLEKADPGWQQSLDFLTDCGFLLFEKNSYSFAHPVYYQAALLLLSELQKGELDEVEYDLKKALSLLSFENAYIAASLLQFIFKHNEQAGKEKLIGLAVWLEQSIYPAIIDVSLILLNEVTPFLNNDQLELAQSRLTQFDDDSGTLRWHKGIPFIPDVDSLGRRLDLDYGLIDAATFAVYQTQLLSNSQSNLTAEEAWNLCKYIKYKSLIERVDVEPLTLNKLLDYNEAFIRSVAAFHIFHQFSAPQEDLINKVVNDAHAFVVLSGIKGFIKGWHQYDEAIKGELLQTMLSAFERENVVIAATNFITQFGIGYAHESFDWKYHIPKQNQPEMWLLWSKFILKFFKKVPVDSNFHTHRFIATIQDSEEILPKQDQAALALAWLNWIRSSKRYHDYSDSLFYVCNYYFNFNESLTLEERAIFADLYLDPQFSYFTANNVRLFLYHWEQLCQEEQNAVLELLKSPNKLLYQAVVLTAAKRPHEINLQILGVGNWEDNPPTEIINVIPRLLLDRCISVKFVSHGYRSLDNASTGLWYGILGQFVNNYDDVLCKVAIKTLLDAFHRFGADKNHTDSWGTPEDLLPTWLKNAGLRDYIYGVLLEEISISSHSKSLPLWELLKANTEDDFHQTIKEGMVEQIKDIESSRNLKIIDKLWGSSFYEKAFPADSIISLFLNSYYEFETPMTDLTSSMSSALTKVAEKNELKLCLTFDNLKYYVENNDPENVILLELAVNGRANYFKEDRFYIREKLRQMVEGPFADIYIDN